MQINLSLKKEIINNNLEKVRSNITLSMKMKSLNLQVKKAKVKKMKMKRMVKKMRMIIWTLMAFRKKLRMSEDTNKKMKRIKILREDPLIKIEAMVKRRKKRRSPIILML